MQAFIDKGICLLKICGMAENAAMRFFHGFGHRVELIVPTIRRINPSATPAEAQDIIAICKGLIHANSQAGREDNELCAESLFAKCLRAVLGYLHHPAPHPS